MNKALFIIFTVATGFIMSPSALGSLFKDEFEEASLDTSRWQMTAPEPDSIVIAEAGAAVFKNGGTLTTVQDLPEKFELYGALDFTGSDADAFEIIFRTDGKLSSSGEPLNGVRLKFLATGDARSVDYKTAIIDVPSGPILVATNFNQGSNPFYFRIADDGSVVRFYFNRDYNNIGGLKHILTIPTRAGNKLTLRNARILDPNLGKPVQTTAWLDYIRVEPFPEPLAYSPEAGMRFLLQGAPGDFYILESSTDLRNWQSIQGFMPGPSGYLATDLEGVAQSPVRFYRVRPRR